MAIAIGVGLVLAVAGFFTGEDHIDGAAILFGGSVAVMAGALIYLLATDDFEARKEIFGAEGADRRGENPAGD
jgi:hypothetical protein